MVDFTWNDPEPLWGDSLLFTTKSPEIPRTHFIDLGRMKGWVDLGAAYTVQKETVCQKILQELWPLH